MSRQCNSNEFVLSLDEICTLAALLGYKKVIGFDKELFEDNPNMAHNSIKLLESKSLIHFGFEGTLIINSNLKQVIEIVANPLALLVVEERKNKLDSKTYRCRNKNKSVQIELTENNKYKLTLFDDCSIDDLISDVPFSSTECEETISTKEYKKLKKSSMSIDDEKISIVIKNAVLKKYKTKSIRLYQKTPMGYTLIKSSVFLFDDICLLTTVDDELMHFNSLNEEELKTYKDNLIREYLKR